MHFHLYRRSSQTWWTWFLCLDFRRQTYIIIKIISQKIILSRIKTPHHATRGNNCMPSVTDSPICWVKKTYNNVNNSHWHYTSRIHKLLIMEPYLIQTSKYTWSCFFIFVLLAFLERGHKLGILMFAFKMSLQLNITKPRLNRRCPGEIIHYIKTKNKHTCLSQQVFERPSMLKLQHSRWSTSS